MRVNNNMSVLPFYKNIEWQKHNLPYSFGGFFPLVTDSNMILPFQIIRDTREDDVLTIELIRRDGSLVEDMIVKMEETGLQVVRFENRGYDIILYPSKFMFGSRYDEGYHYLRISDGVEEWYSEVFTFVHDTANYLRLEWFNLYDLEMDKGAILYHNPNFQNYMYLFAEVAKPEYPYQEEGETRDGVFYPEKQISWKQYNFTFVATEPMLDVLRLVMMSDFISVRNRSRLYECKSMLITPEDWLTGDISSVTAEFTTDTIVKKMGGFFNNDFNCCGGGSTPGECVIPVSLAILGEGNPTEASTQTYILQKTGGSGAHVVQWVVTGGTIQGSSNGNSVTILWATPGNRNIYVEVTCDGSSYVNTNREIVVKSTCTPASFVDITGSTTGSIGSETQFYANITGGSNQSIVWSVSGGTIISGQGTNTVMIQWGSTGGNYNVNVSVTCGENTVSDTHSFSLINPGSCVNPTGVEISGDDEVAASSTKTYTSVKTGGNAGNTYMWGVNGGTIVGSSTGTSVVINWGAVAMENAKVYLYVQCPGSGTSVYDEIIVAITGGTCDLPSSIAIIGPSTGTLGGTSVYTLSGTGGSGYTIEWLVGSPSSSPDGEIIGPNNGTSVTIEWRDTPHPSHPGVGLVSVIVSCGGGSYLEESRLITMVEAEEGVLFRMPSHPQPSGINTTDWAPFSNFTNPIGIKNVAGDGFGLWANEAVDGSGKLTLLNIGWTNIYDISAFARSKWGPENIYTWSLFYYMFNNAVRECVAAGITGVVGGIDYGDMNATTAPGDLWNTNIPYYNLTIAGMIEVGKRIAGWGTSNSIDDASYNITGEYCVVMIDEESMTPYSWAGGHHNEMIGYIIEGIMTAQPTKHVFIYAQPISWAFNNIHNLRQSDGTYLDSDILALFNPSNVLYGSAGFSGRKFYIDTSGGYTKVPFLSETNIYDHSGGSIVMVGGKRKYRSTDFTISHYGKTETILASPHDWIKWNGLKADNSPFYGWQSEWGTFTGQDMTSSLPSGWSWGSTARPNPASWKTEAELFVEGCYTRANGIIHDMLCINYREKGTWLTSEATDRIRSYQEMRPRTEPWTANGNSIEIREIGVDGIAFNRILFAYCGGLAFSTWDDGGSVIPRPNKPGQLWGEDQYYGRYETALAAYRQAFNELQGVNPTALKYAIFYYPFKGQNNHEAIAAGIYHGTRFYFCVIDPNREHGEDWTMELAVGPSVFNLTMTGHEFWLGNFDVPSGLNPQDMTVEYNTIYGMNIKTNGRVQNDFSAHYE